jgi:ubiquinone/menaquinone biosynthesis C-methylase UbiE
MPSWTTSSSGLPPSWMASAWCPMCVGAPSEGLERQASGYSEKGRSMADSHTCQVTRSAAEVYEEFFVPALFLEWAPRVADAAQIAPGQKVLDVACGTGVLAREAARRVGPGGAVTGLDRNEGMLAVARRKSPHIDWQLGMAEALGFADGTMDAVVSQFGLMFFEDRRAALREMWRVARPGGRIAVAVWAALESAPGYAAMTDLLQRLFGDRIADALRAPFTLGDSHWGRLGALPIDRILGAYGRERLDACRSH